jgi:hypothetical protein
VLEDWRARLISVELRKVILVASQFFEFLHSLGHQRRFKDSSRASASRPIPDASLRRIARRRNRLTRDEARPMAGGLRQAAGAAAPAAADKRGVRGRSRTFHDSPRDVRLAPNSGSIAATNYLT